MTSRASYQQISILIEYMERYGDISRPHEGVQGRLQSLRKWSELTEILNAQGSGCTKSIEKWKKFWADLKSKTKKKAATMRAHSGGTGGGPASRIKLSVLEERIVAILGVVATSGISTEIGFPDMNDSEAVEDSIIADPSFPAASTRRITSPSLALPAPVPSTSQNTTPQSNPSTQPVITAPSTSQITPLIQQMLPSIPDVSSPLASTSRGAVGITEESGDSGSPMPEDVLEPPVNSSTRRTRDSGGPMLEDVLESPVNPNTRRTGSRRPDLRRRRRLPTPFQMAAERFADVENSRLEIERMRVEQTNRIITLLERLGERFIQLTNHMVGNE